MEVSKRILYNSLILPLITISIVCFGVLTNLLLFGGLVAIASEQNAIILINVAPPYLIWVGIIILITGVIEITKNYTIASFSTTKNESIIDWLLLLSLGKASFGVGMIIYYQFFAVNLP